MNEVVLDSVTGNSPAQPRYRWHRGEGLGWSDDAIAFQKRATDLLHKRGFEVALECGPVLGQPLTVWRRVRAGAPACLVAAGFHGEEPAGPWGVLKFLEEASDELLDRLSLTVLPLVNVTGFSVGRRYNDAGENPNSGYGQAGAADPSSAEGRALMAHAEALAQWGADGVLACHEHVEVTQAYAYVFERSERPGPLSKALIQTAEAYFPIYPDGDVDGCPISGGVVFNHLDGSFESWMTELGAKQAACVETPGAQAFADRVRLQRDWIEVFLKVALQGA